MSPTISGDATVMRRSFALAVKGKGKVNPNPMVGCVIVRKGRVVGEGFHGRFGGPHAEVNALRKAGKHARGATMFVNLEPCAHHGKTPPCVEAIIKAGIKRVVTACTDPNPLVAGRGVARLRKAGVDVRVGLLGREAERLNEKFFMFMRHGIPFVGIKIAQTLDGRIADSSGRSKWITSEAARTEAHRIRSTYDAILVGANTIAKDDPELTVRLVKGRNPLRVVVDGRLGASIRSRVFKTRTARTLVLTSLPAVLSKRKKVSELLKRGIPVLALGRSKRLDPLGMLHTLAALGISSVLVEGGSVMVSEFVRAKLVRKVHCFVAPKFLGGGLNSLNFVPGLGLSKAIQVQDRQWKTIGTDFLIEGSLRYA
jgi:diaminohydroxyphosphoribosylaminopyrimidine deaminase/5-amino-6-(5-phosphoribosylamino)uracil reductase